MRMRSADGQHKVAKIKSSRLSTSVRYREFASAVLVLYTVTCSARLERDDPRDEHVASFSYSVKPREWYPEGHPVQTLEGNPNLPEGCISYEEKYSRVGQEKHRVFDPNEANPHTRHVVLVRTYAEGQWKDDLVVFLRSAMVELNEAGIHMYLLIEESMNEDPSPDAAPERFRQLVPPALRPLAFFFNQNDIHNQYPEVHEFAFAVREYLPVTWFMHRYPAYDFVWRMEHDVRYTGPSLGTFLNAALLVAIETLHRNDPEQEGPSELLQAYAGDKEHFFSRAAHKDPAKLPDLVLFGEGSHISTTSQTELRDSKHWNFTEMVKHQAQLIGMTQRLGQQLHSFALEGVGGFIEEFLPTMAKETGLSIVTVPVSTFIGESFHCCTNASEVYYQDWYLSKQCRHYALLHPVKLEDKIWGSPGLRD